MCNSHNCKSLSMLNIKKKDVKVIDATKIKLKTNLDVTLFYTKYTFVVEY